MNKKNLFIAIGTFVAAILCFFYSFHQGTSASHRASLSCAIIFTAISIIFFRHIRD